MKFKLEMKDSDGTKYETGIIECLSFDGVSATVNAYASREEVETVTIVKLK